jgi:hypothetical protein
LVTGGAAHRGGLVSGDALLEINEMDATGYSAGEALRRITEGVHGR